VGKDGFVDVCYDDYMGGWEEGYLQKEQKGKYVYYSINKKRKKDKNGSNKNEYMFCD